MVQEEMQEKQNVLRASGEELTGECDGVLIRAWLSGE
jgi:hypothetical protein